MKKILVTGASGMVGYAVCREALKQSMEVIGCGRDDRHRIPGMRFVHVDLTDAVAVTAMLQESAPELVIHLAANTSHGECERNPAATRRLHVDASEQLAGLALNLAARFVHISTEAVYGNLGTGCRLESDVCQSTGVYATTKRQAEERVLQVNPGALVLRVTPVGFTPNGSGRSLAEWLLGQFVRGNDVTGFVDAWFTPISSSLLAELLMNPKLANVCGIYNWGIGEVMTKYDFAVGLAEVLGLRESKVLAGRRDPDGNGCHGGMDATALATALRIPLPSAAALFADLAQHRPCVNPT